MKMNNKSLDKAYREAKKSLTSRRVAQLDIDGGTGGGGGGSSADFFTPRPPRKPLNAQLNRVTSATPSKKTKKVILKETGEYRQDAGARRMKKIMKRKAL